MAVFQHALEALTHRGAPFDSFSRSQGPPPKQELHEWSQSSPHSHQLRVPGASRNLLASVKKAHFVAGEYGLATLRILAPLFSQEAALHVSRVQIRLPDEDVEKHFNAACGLGRLWRLC
jgi:hypothetical protein